MRSISIIPCICFLVFFLSAESINGQSNINRVTVYPKNIVEHQLNSRLFGQFLECPDGGETGPEKMVTHYGKLPDDVVEALRNMRIPIVRYYGGTVIDYSDWTDKISNVPGREVIRPNSMSRRGTELTNNFGYDEYFELAEELGWESIIVINMLDALSGKKSLNEAKLHAAGLVAYCNAPVGAALPEGMPDWPNVRMVNGHQLPYKVKIFELGNEWNVGDFNNKIKEGAKLNQYEDPGEWCIHCIISITDAMREIDPGIEFILDGMMNGDIRSNILTDQRIKERVKYITYHQYLPGTLFRASLNGKALADSDLTPEEWFLALGTVPGRLNDEGMIEAYGDRLKFANEHGYKTVVTEWNWVGWNASYDGLVWQHAAGIGTSGFLNGLIRDAGSIELATQSMLIGNAWSFAAIHYDIDFIKPTFLSAQGMATGFYSKYHGNKVLRVETGNIPYKEQPYTITVWGFYNTPGNAALIDIVATGSEDKLFVHIVNKDYSNQYHIDIDLSDFQVSGKHAVSHILSGVPRDDFPKVNAWMKEETKEYMIATNSLGVVAPKQSLCIIEIPVTMQ